jgi:hypothetical protein
VCLWRRAARDASRAVLPEHHPSIELDDVLKLLLGLIGAMAVLVLLIATAASSDNARNSEFKMISANIIVLDRVLALYWLETKEALIYSGVRSPTISNGCGPKTLPRLGSASTRRMPGPEFFMIRSKNSDRSLCRSKKGA